MSVFTEIDSLARQTDNLVEQERRAGPKPPPPEPTDCSAYEGMPNASKPPQCRTAEVELTTVEEENGADNGSSSKQAASETNGSSSGSEQSEPVSAGGPSESGLPQTMEAVGQTLTTTWNEKVLPELKKVDPKVYWAIGGTAAVLLIINANR